MRDVTGLSVKQFRIFERPIIPLSLLATGGVSKILTEVTGSVSFGMSEETNEVILTGLPFIPEGSESGFAANAILGFRRVVVEVDGDSEVADSFFAYLAKRIEEVRACGLAEASPLVKTEETTCQVTFDFDWRKLFSRQFVRFIDGPLQDSISAEEGVAELISTAFGAVYRFHAKKHLIDHGVVLSNKPFRVEPSKDMPLSSKRYSTGSPTGSDSHLRLLQELESCLSGESP